jgi:deoxyribodipyrimidine photo-lyase
MTLAVSLATADAADRAAYLEGLVVRRELAINFVERHPRYVSYSCPPEWRTAVKRSWNQGMMGIAER